MHISWIPRPRPHRQRHAAVPRAPWRWAAATVAAATTMVALTAASAPGAAVGGTVKAATPVTPGPVSCGPPHVLPLVLCYTPHQYQVAYGVAALLSHGIDGRGQTVVVPEPAETPLHGGTIYTDIRRDLAKFDSRFGLPAARLRVVNSIAHSKTPFLAGTEEVEDTEIIHAIAPGATLDVPILPSPASRTSPPPSPRWCTPGSCRAPRGSPSAPTTVSISLPPPR